MDDYLEENCDKPERPVGVRKVILIALGGYALAGLQSTWAETTAFAYDRTGNEISQQTAVAAPPVILGSPPNQVAALGGIGGFSVTVASPLPVTYQWYFNGAVIVGATGDSLLLTNISGANEGNYTVVVTNSSGSVTSGTFTLAIDYNGNGLPDSWEMAHFGNLNQTVGGDFDGDGISNLDEYYNGTDPTVREIYYWNVASGDFNTATNWIRHNTPGIPPRVPSAGDTAVIDSGSFTLPTNTTITVSQVTVNAAFTVPTDTNFTLNITGHWTFNGPFSLADGRQFAVSGNGGSVTVTATTNLNGANLLAYNGAKLSFMGVGTYTLPGNYGVVWHAQHNGSELSLPNLTTIIGGDSANRYLDLQASEGAKLSFPALTTISKPSDGDGNHNSGVRLFVSDNNSVLSAPELSTFNDNDAYPNSSLTAYNGGVLSAPLLTAPVGVNIDLNALSHPEQFTSLVGARSLRINSGTVTLGNLTSISGLTVIHAYNGAKVNLPTVTAYTPPVNYGVVWHAQHNGSELTFPNLTTITGGASANRYLDLQASEGAKLSVPALTTISKPSDGDGDHNSGVRLLVSDNNSVLSAPELSTFNDNDSYPNSSLTAYNGGVLSAPLLTAPVGVNIDLNALSHPEQFTSLVGARTLRINAGTVTLNNLTSISGLTLIHAYNGGKVSLPTVMTYTLPANYGVVWHAQHNGSELTFPNLTAITGGTSANRYLDLQASEGGRLSLPALTTIINPGDGDADRNSGVRLSVSGNNSILSAPFLSTFYDNDSHPNSSLNASNGGTMILYSLALSGIRGVTLNGVTLPPTVPPPKAINLSTRMLVQTGDNVGIGGFIITGSTTKRVMIRAIGPSLVGFGVPNALADPVLELHGPSAFVTITNNNWRDTQQTEILATGIPPTNDLESAIVATLVPGPYTAVVSGNGDTSGVGLIEVYDLNQVVDAKLANLSTRAAVNTGDNIVIAGFVLSIGNGNDRIVVRGLGPSLTAFGVPSALANPKLELRDTHGALLASNNDWHDDLAQAAELAAAGLAPTDSLESAMVARLPTGLYTALLSGTNGGTGIGVVEVYDLGGTP